MRISLLRNLLFMLCWMFLMLGCARTVSKVENAGELGASGGEVNQGQIKESDQKVGLVVESGKKNGVWVRGHGHLKGNLDEIYQKLKDYQVVAPRGMDRVKGRDFIEGEEGFSFFIDCEVRFIVLIAFTMQWDIKAVKEGGKIVGYEARGVKSAGSSYIKRIEHVIEIREVSEGYLRFEMSSENEAARDKEEESRDYVEAVYQALSGGSL